MKNYELKAQSERTPWTGSFKDAKSLVGSHISDKTPGRNDDIEDVMEPRRASFDLPLIISSKLGRKLVKKKSEKKR